MIRAGQRLSEERNRKGLTIEEVSKATKIKASFLSAIEKSDYTKLPSSTYASGFVKNYAEFLGLPKKEILALFRREFDENKDFKVLPSGFVKNDDFPIQRFRIGQTFLIILFIFLGLIGYLAFQYRYAILNPPLEIYSPKQKTASQRTIVSGRTDPNVTLLINDSPVSLDDKGNFKKTLDLFPGKATIKIKAINRFGRKTEIDKVLEVQ